MGSGKMNRLFCLFCVVLALSAGGCLSLPGDKGSYARTKNGPAEFYFPTGWRPNQAENPYDLQYASSDESLNTGVFLFKKEEFAQPVDTRKVFELQIDDLRSKRQNFQIVEEAHTTQLKDKTLTTVIYTGERDRKKYYYRFTLIHFNESPQHFAVVTQVAIPSKWQADRTVLEEITRSARITVDVEE